jgi:hypothetical protein
VRQFEIPLSKLPVPLRVLLGVCAISLWVFLAITHPPQSRRAPQPTPTPKPISNEDLITQCHVDVEQALQRGGTPANQIRSNYAADSVASGGDRMWVVNVEVDAPNVARWECDYDGSSSNGMFPHLVILKPLT